MRYLFMNNIKNEVYGKMKYLLGLIVAICFCLPVLAEPPGTKILVVFEVSPGSGNGGMQNNPYVTVAIEHSNIAKAELAWVSSAEEVDRFHITFELKEYGTTTARIVINRSGYILELVMVSITVSDEVSSIPDRFIERTLIPVGRASVFNFEYGLFNWLWHDRKHIKIPYRE